jgi:hypothetical protein
MAAKEQIFDWRKRMQLVASLVLCVPLLLFVAAIVALALRRRTLAVILGLLSATTIVALVILVWQAYVSWNPVPHCFQDVDHIPEVACIGDWAYQLSQVAVDHVYYYNTQRLRSSQFLRCHIIHKADFEKYRQMIRSGVPLERSGGEKDGIAESLGAGSREYGTIKSWWDWPERPGCDVFCLDESFIVVFDEARSIVYVARGGD